MSKLYCQELVDAVYSINSSLNETSGVLCKDSIFKRSESISSDKGKGIIFHDLRKELAPETILNEPTDSEPEILEEYPFHMTESKKKTMVNCPICQKQFRFNCYLKKHMVKHTNEKPFICLECPSKFAFQQSLADHMKKHNGGLVDCEICRKKISPKYYPKHLETIHNLKRVLKCRKCQRKFTTQYLRHNHRCISDDNNSLTCKVCNKSFAEKRNLKRHILIHNPQICKYECKICHKKYCRKDYLNLHKRVHTKEKPYSCQLCSLRFTQKCSLKMHIKLHTGENCFDCKTCGRSFTRQARLLKHEYNHVRLQKINEMIEADEKELVESKFETSTANTTDGIWNILNDSKSGILT